MTNRDYLENRKSDKEFAVGRIKCSASGGYYVGDFNGRVRDYWDAIDREIDWLNEEYHETSTKKT